MSKSNKTYTYRCGQKIELNKSADQIIVRMSPEALGEDDIIASEKVSSASYRLTMLPENLETAMAHSRELAPTHHAYYETETGQELLTTDRVLVTFHEELSDQQMDEFTAYYALVTLAKYSARDYLFQLTNYTGMNPVKLVVKLMEDEDLVINAELDLNQRMRTNNIPPPIDPEYFRQWHLHNNLNHPDFDARSSTECEDAWHLLGHFGNEEVVVAVSDDGCKLNHVDFDSAIKFADWGYLRGGQLISSLDIGSEANEMYKAGANHGTSCCGVIGGEVDARLTVGAAPGCQLLPVQWESSGPYLLISDSKLLTVLNFIADKADIMSNSWGGAPNNIWSLQVVQRIEDLAKNGGRRAKGLLFLWAAGNENCLIHYTTNQDVPYTDGWEYQNGSWVWIGVETSRIFSNNLVGIPGVMHIAALASTAKRSHYSNYGPGLTLCAPSSNSCEYGPRITVKGLGITTATGDAGGVSYNFGGTSSATPLVAGIAALTISANPELSALDVMSILKKTASKDLDFNGYPRVPAASYDPDTRWDISPIAPFANGDFIDDGEAEGSWSPWFGHGRVDAHASVAEALSRIQTRIDKNFNASSEPDRSIPDNNSRGISDKIACTASFVISSFTVTLNITHTYISDLQVTLISPAGTSVLLHNRAGGSTHDIHRAYTVNDVPALHALTGESVSGEWRLWVQDLATEDRGRLQSWSVDINGREATDILVEESPGIIIPDNRQVGIERVLSVSATGQLDEITVELDITHSYISDLVVELLAPDNTSVLLHNQQGGSADNIIKTFSLLNTAALNMLRGVVIKGDWRLKVSDHAGADQGKLNRWALQLSTR